MELCKHSDAICIIVLGIHMKIPIKNINMTALESVRACVCVYVRKRACVRARACKTEYACIIHT